VSNSPSVHDMAVLVLTRHHRIRGGWRGVAGHESIAEALNDERGGLSLATAFVQELDGSRPSIMPTIALDKSQITAVVLKGIAVHQSGSDAAMAAASPGRTVVVLSVPPYMAQGDVHWRFAREIGRLGTAEAREGRSSSLPRFFELTDAWLFSSLTPLASHAALLVNRDHVTETHVLGQASGSEGGLSDLFSGMR